MRFKYRRRYLLPDRNKNANMSKSCFLHFCQAIKTPIIPDIANWASVLQISPSKLGTDIYTRPSKLGLALSVLFTASCASSRQSMLFWFFLLRKNQKTCWGIPQASRTFLSEMSCDFFQKSILNCPSNFHFLKKWSPTFFKNWFFRKDSSFIFIIAPGTSVSKKILFLFHSFSHVFFSDSLHFFKNSYFSTLKTALSNAFIRLSLHW